MDYLNADTIQPEAPVDGRKFIVVPYRALKDKKMTFGRLKVLMAVCSYANHQGNTWPGIPRLAEDTGFHISTVQAHIRTLTQGGYLKTVNNSYTVGMHAKPRMVIYDPDNPPHPDDYKVEDKESPIEQAANIGKPEQSKAQPLADPTSLYVLWRKHMQERFGITPPFEEALYRRLSTRYTVERFEEAARVFLSASTAPPPSVGVLLR